MRAHPSCSTTACLQAAAMIVAVAAAQPVAAQPVAAQPVTPHPVTAQPVTPRPAAAGLPDPVKSWLERDQLRRWASLLRTGEERFAAGSCSKCHGEGGKGGRGGPDLTDSAWSHSEGDLEGIRETIFWGVRRRDLADPSRPFEMNPSGGMELEWEEVDALAAYAWSLSHGTFLPQSGW